jgi:AraC family transcriptional regulator of adaptative response/methylated-DNA-[protein]-cysteine methyltransferase
MQSQASLNYRRIAEAIGYINDHFQEQPHLDEVAEKINLSPYHFQKLFSDWVGTTPKKFLQYISVQHAKRILRNERATLFDTAFETGLSSTSRLHDLFVKVEGMTPAEYKNGGKNLEITFSFAESPFGSILVASTAKGVCYMAFVENEGLALADLKSRFPNAQWTQKLDLLQQNALFIFQNDWSRLHEIKLHLKGTDFQLKVWESLLKIPMGSLSTYGSIAEQVGNPNASRAVGTAIGSNPVAFLIPCHRVIQSTGALWGVTRKSAIIGWEAAKMNVNPKP